MKADHADCTDSSDGMEKILAFFPANGLTLDTPCFMIDGGCSDVAFPKT